MNTTLSKFRKPLDGICEPKSDIRYWEIANESFDAKKYRESTVAVLNYINPELLKDVDVSKGDFEISHQHGSAQINLRVKNDTLRILVPFLRIDKAQKIPLMRRAAEINFHPLTLPQIVLKDHFLVFYYATTLDLCQPNKLYDVLKEICFFSDCYDDEFIDKYKADFYKKPKITPLNQDEKEAVWDHFQELISEYKKYSKYFEEKRWPSLQFSIILLVIMNMANMPYVNGMLRSDLDEYLANLYDTGIDFNYRLDKGKKFLNDLFSNMTKENLFKNLYHADKFISLKFRATPEYLQQYFEERKSNVNDFLNNSGTYEASFYLLVAFMKVLCDFNLEEKHKTIIYDALEKSGGQDSNVAVDILMTAFDRFLNGDIDNVKPAKKGFFAKLFG